MNDNKKYKAPRKDEEKDWRVTPVMLAETYDERLGAEKAEVMAATIMAETFPELLDYEVPEYKKEQSDKDEKE